MSVYAELVGTNLDAWRAHVEGLIVEDGAALEAHMDGLQGALQERGCYIANGKEVEFELVALDGSTPPDRREFYDDYVKRMCGDAIPQNAGKAEMVDPIISDTPIMITKDGDKYRWETEADGACMETVTRPSYDWRESDRRYWNVIGTLGEMAVERGCRVKILATHMSTTFAWMSSHDGLLIQRNEEVGDMLVAMQRARRALQPFEPYTSILRRPAESYPSKAALWSIGEIRTEKRYPEFGIVDTRLAMLGALAGAKQEVFREVERDPSVLHRCSRLEIDSTLWPEVDALSGLMVWDHKLQKMVFPETMTRASILASRTQKGLKKLDELVKWLTFNREIDSCADNASVLREAIEALRLNPDECSIDVDGASPYARVWNVSLALARIEARPALRIALPGVLSEGYELDREKAMASPEVEAILGHAIMASLTSPRKANQRRALVLSTRQKPAVKAQAIAA